MTRAQRIWHARLWLVISLALAAALTSALLRRAERSGSPASLTLQRRAS